MKIARLFCLVVICFSACSTSLPLVGVSVTKQSTPIIQPYTRVNDYASDPYPFVGSFVKPDGSLIGSGIVIHPRIVLTAGHVLSPESDLGWFKDFDGTLHKIKKIIIHDMYEPIPGLIVYDIGIAVLETDSHAHPIDLIDDSSMLYKNKPITSIGFGQGFKRYSNDGVFKYYGRTIETPNTFSWLTTEWTVWFGDSGGAVIIIEDSKPKLIGIIVSLGTNGKKTIIDNNATSIVYFREWIATTTTTNAHLHEDYENETK